MSLTDDWKGGKLKYGWYWVTNSKKGVVPDQYMPDDNWLVSGGFNVIEVLAPCDYDHFVELNEKVKALGKEVAKGDRIIGELLNEGDSFRVKNRQLHEVLKECRPALSHLGKWNTQRQSLLTRINAALGESEE